MKIVVDVTILRADAPQRGVHSMVRREYLTGMVPVVGMELEDMAWKQSRKIDSVVMNPVEGYYFITVGDDAGKSEEQCEALLQMYLGHGWKDLSSIGPSNSR